MSRELNKEEIKKRLIRLNNLEHLHITQGNTLTKLKEENRDLKAEIITLKEIVAEQKKIITNLLLRVEELTITVFGKKKKTEDKSEDDNQDNTTIPKARSKESYKRPIPQESEITDTVTHSLNTLCNCGACLTNIQEVTFYVEDIPVPIQKTVIKHIAYKAKCISCNTIVYSTDIPCTKVTLGNNIRKYICYLSVYCRLSFTQIQQLLVDTYNTHVSQGEIVKILNREATKLLPMYEELKTRLRQESVLHLDESSWKLLLGRLNAYAWVMSGATSKESVFLLGESRGKGNAQALLGDNYQGVVVTDDYAVYDFIKNHQLCFAHLIRKWRDLAFSSQLDEETSKHCKAEYNKLMTFYHTLETNRDMQHKSLYQKMLSSISIIHKLDPKKLVTYKRTLKSNINKYLTCLQNKDIPFTNNQAERSLRHLVIKRKISLGSNNKNTAKTLAILLSVIMSMRQRYQGMFFREWVGV